MSKELKSKNRSILIISSCGKRKLTDDANKPWCDELQTEQMRKKAKEKFKTKLTPASDLYTGAQATAVRKGIQSLRKLFTVEHYILSAGFGLVHESEELPPYECTFAGKRKAEIRSMASDLRIQASLEKIQGPYDLIYLALGKDYISAIPDLTILSNIAKEIVHFSKSLNLDSPFLLVDDSLLVGKHYSGLPYSIGGFIESKGSLFRNFVNFVIQNHSSKEESKELLFNEFCQHLMTTYGMPDIRVQSNEPTTQKRYKKKGGKQTLSTSNLASESAKEVDSFSNKELVEINTAVSDLRTVNAKKDNNREEYFEFYSSHVPQYRGFIDKMEQCIENVQEKTGKSKKDIKNEIFSQLQKRIESQVEARKLNQVKYGIMRTIVRMHDNPDMLKKPISAPKSKSKQSSGKRSNLEKPKIMLDIYSVQALQDSKNLYKIEFGINNPTTFPLQNILISLEDKNGNKIPIERAEGKWVEYTSEEITLPVLFAEMNDQHTTQTIIVVISDLLVESLSHINISGDFPPDSTRIDDQFEFTRPL